MSCTPWVNRRELGEWLKITNAPERLGPLKVLMGELARRGASAGINLRIEGESIRFDHTAALTLAIKDA